MIEKPILIYALFIFIYALFLPITTDVGMAVSYLGSYFLYFILMLMFYYYCRNKQYNKLEGICRIVFAWVILMCIFAILYYQKYPGAARLHATHRSDLGEYMIGGGYQIAYISAFLLPVLIARFIGHSNNKKDRLRIIIAMLIMVVLIWRTASVITMASAVVGCVVSFGFCGRNRRSYLTSIIVLISLALLFIFRYDLGQILIDIAGDAEVTSYSTMSNATYVRLREIGQMLQGDNLSSSSAFSLRIANYTKSLDDIRQRLFTGCLFTTGVNPEASNYNDSTFISSIVCWGLPMTLLFFYPLFSGARRYKFNIGSFVVMMLTLFLNPSNGFSVYAGIFFIFPAIGLLEEKSPLKISSEPKSEVPQ